MFSTASLWLRARGSDRNARKLAVSAGPHRTGDRGFGVDLTGVVKASRVQLVS